MTNTTIYAAVIEWPSRLIDAEPSLILARSREDRDTQIAAEIRETAEMLTDYVWTDVIEATGTGDWPVWLTALDLEAGEQPFVTTYDKELPTA